MVVTQLDIMGVDSMGQNRISGIFKIFLLIN